MQEIINIFESRGDQIFSALGDHLLLSLIALTIAALIALPLAIILSKREKAAEVMLQVTSVFQTIPSLAILGLLIPIVGIGQTPAIIALVIYGILPIFQNTYVGLTEIDPSIQEASEAFGMSRWQKLTKVEVPMAMPMIISGIRTSLVMIIGTATLAALIGAGGLGEIILLGIDRNQPMLTLVGAVLSALLAIIMSSLIKWLQNKPSKKIVLTLGLVALLLAGGLVYRGIAQSGPSLTIAGKMGSEPEILINMYKEIIQDDHEQVDIEVKPNFGKTSFLFDALNTDEIQLYPEFTGTVLGNLVDLPDDVQMADLTEEAAYDLSNDLLADQYQMRLLEPMNFQNTYALAMRREDAENLGIETISDLQEVDDQLTAGMTLEFIDREDGYAGIQDLYGINFSEVVSMEPGLRYQAIANGEVDVVDAYSTDSEILQYDLVTLEDDLGLFPPYQAAPIVTQDFANDYPELVDSINRLGGMVTEEEMIEMNYAVNVDMKEANDVAREYLIGKGLIEEDNND